NVYTVDLSATINAAQASLDLSLHSEQNSSNSEPTDIHSGGTADLGAHALTSLTELFSSEPACNGSASAHGSHLSALDHISHPIGDLSLVFDHAHHDMHHGTGLF